jgi:tRNA dimethylallyltransferase
MNDKRTLPALVAVVGPTASGKSALGLWLAEQLGGEVIACDSTQLYRGFDVGTAKPSEAEQHAVPHHLLDVLSPAEKATAGGYRQMALPVLEDLRRRGRLPIFTVGTGLYLRALLDGLADLPQRSEELRERLRASAADHSPGHLHGVLERLDRAAAQKIGANDAQKLIRAIEICILARKPITEVHQTGRTPLHGWRALKLGLTPPREALYERIHARTEEMLSRGWMDEVRSLLATGLPENVKPFDFMGYRELRSVVRGEMTLEIARAAIQQATRRYAKRQLTWFRNEAGVHWFEGFGHDSKVQNAALLYLRDQGLRTGRGAEATSV